MSTNVNKVSETNVPVKLDPNKYKDLSSTSAKIRAMYKDGWTKGEITRLGGLKTKAGNDIRYQHVRNVLLQGATVKNQ